MLEVHLMSKDMRQVRTCPVWAKACINFRWKQPGPLHICPIRSKEEFVASIFCWENSYLFLSVSQPEVLVRWVHTWGSKSPLRTGPHGVSDFVFAAPAAGTDCKGALKSNVTWGSLTQWSTWQLPFSMELHHAKATLRCSCNHIWKTWEYSLATAQKRVPCRNLRLTSQKGDLMMTIQAPKVLNFWSLAKIKHLCLWANGREAFLQC